LTSVLEQGPRSLQGWHEVICVAAGILIGVPVVVGFTVSRILAEPFYEIAQRYNPQVFALSDREKIEGAKEVLTLTTMP
jgi:hypothetical protein